MSDKKSEKYWCWNIAFVDFHYRGVYEVLLVTVKEEYLYSAFLAKEVHSKRSGIDHTVLPANTMPAFPSWRSPDVTTTATEAADIQLQLTTHLSTPKG